LPHRILCELPWFEAEGVVGDTAEVDAEKRDENAVDKRVKEQLQDLGYA
jgi:hypothetical protein